MIEKSKITNLLCRLLDNINSATDFTNLTE